MQPTSAFTIAGLVVAIFSRSYRDLSTRLQPCSWPPNLLHPLTKEASRVTRIKMPNEHTEYEGEVDVPAAAIQIKDPAVVASK